MANQEHLDILKQGRDVWNIWRNEHPEIQPDLSDCNLTEFSNADLSNTNLSNTNLCRTSLAFTDLSGANLQSADVFGTTLLRANFDGANLDRTCFSFSNLREANFMNAIHINRVIINGANLYKADLSKCNLSGVNFNECNLSEANLSSTDLTGANLSRAILIETNMSKATLTGCSVYGISAWGVELEGATQSSLVITPANEPTITVDNLEVAQFIYLILNNQKIRDVINTIGQKGVLILGRFSEERKLVLDALREKLRSLNFLPIVFDFERSTERDFTETIMTLAGLSCFIIADITNPKSSPLELQATVPNYMIPFVPIIQEDEQPFSMFQDLKGKYGWVLDILVYDTLSNLIKGFERAVVTPAIEMRDELLSKKVEQLRTRHIGDFL